MLLASIASIPTPYCLIAPGNAVDLSRRVMLQGRRPPPDRYFLTDVTVLHASALLLLGGLLPDVRVVREDALVPEGESPSLYDRYLLDSMVESQEIAAVVAERAAGFHVAEPAHNLIVAGILPASRAREALAVGDSIVAVDGRPVTQPLDVGRILDRWRDTRRVPVEIRRGGRTRTFAVRPIRTPKGMRLGLLLETRSKKIRLPVPVRYSLANIEGSSGGLMLALAVYATLCDFGAGARRAIAGTGTLRYDGTVGPIQGTAQKLIAAKRAGASLFLVPAANYADVAAERDMRVVPVITFREALAALGSTPSAGRFRRAALGRCAQTLRAARDRARERVRDRVRPLKSS